MGAGRPFRRKSKRGSDVRGFRSTWRSMAFAGEPVDLKMLEEEQARRAEKEQAPASDKPRPLS